MVPEFSSSKSNVDSRLEGEAKLTEIRIASNCKQLYESAEFNNNWHWHPNSHGNQKMLGVILQSCNVIAGEGTHWIEERASDSSMSIHRSKL